MKKIFTILAFLTLSSLAFAELHPFNRFFEIAIDTEAGASNNLFKMKDIFTETILLDLNRFQKDLPKSGWNLNTSFDNSVKISINTRKVRISFFNHVEGAVAINLEKGLFDFICEGNKGKISEKFDMKIYGDVFEEAGVSVFVKARKFALTVAPTLYLPLVYIPNDPAKMRISQTSTGLNANFSADVNIYSAISLENPGSNINASEIIKNVGFQLSFEVEKRFLESLDLGFYMTIPFSPGKVKYLRKQTLSWNMEFDNLIGAIDGDNSQNFDFNFGEAKFYSADMKVYRPLTFGVEAQWKPFGSWFIVNGLFGLKLKNPYDSEHRIVFPEYSAGARLSLVKILEFGFETKYKNKIFMQCLGFTFNFRVLQIDVKAILQGPTFASSFRLSGGGAFVGVKLGF